MELEAIVEPITEAIITALRVGLIIIPLLFLIDIFNHKIGEDLKTRIQKSKIFMPFFGAIFGLLPGCNIAVAVAIMLTQGLTTLGTLVAALIATSDEALYVFIPLGYNFLPLIIIKFTLALIAGFSIDLIYRRFRLKATGKDIEVDFCCAQHPHQHGIKGMFIHALKHGFRVVSIVFLVLAVLNTVQDAYGFDFIKDYFANIELIQPVIMGILGLIPGCGTSVAIATLLNEHVITFGAAVAGLSTASGEALIVLAAKGVERKKIAEIALLLLFFGVIGGYIVQLVF